MDEDWTPENWLGDYHVSANDMNKLIMDYLITGVSNRTL